MAGSQGDYTGEALAESGTPYWNTEHDDDDDDCGPKPSELYGKFTWKINNFSAITKREVRSNTFDVGGHKWYILLYPQGCDVVNQLSLFLCVANHDKLLPGWSHVAQFTLAVMNKDPKKSKYSDTLHRYWRKEHDWGWKKYMALSQLLDGFIIDDTLVMKAQVQVIRENLDRPFRCLDCVYRRELVRVYLDIVEELCRSFLEERRGKLEKLIDDEAMWSSFSSFWSTVKAGNKRKMCTEKTNVIWKMVVKHFFIDKEVTSTLVMDSLYGCFKSLECQHRSNIGGGKSLDTEETTDPIVCIENGMFVLAGDVLELLQRAARESLPVKDGKVPPNRTTDGNSGQDLDKNSTGPGERRLMELGRRTLEIFVLSHIFSSKIEIAHLEDVALKKQDELIREEAAAKKAEREKKARR